MLSADYPIQCRCGRLQGTLSRTARVTRLSCYCLDCQSYAHALGDPGRILDAHGGTEVVATLQQYLTFTAGNESLACLSLSPQGILRWYAGCCNTPIANTTRDPKLSYVGIVHTCLGAPAARTAAFGPPRAPVNTRHAKGKVATSALNVSNSIVRVVARVLRARLDGSWRRSPFFRSGSSTPVVARRVLSVEERERARNAARVWQPEESSQSGGAVASKPD
ncbi:MAG TPA: DUF6151 family protein [Hyphomicrobiaceae bacterium]